jgi:hypothetical protein
MRRLLPVLAAVLALGGCATLSTGSDFDHAVDFAPYHSFAWLPRAHTDSPNPLNAQRVQDAIQAELEAKGLHFEADLARADLAVDFKVGATERTDITTYPVEFRGGWRWGGGYFGNEIDVHQYQEGTLVINLFDARGHRPVWHGWASKPLSRADLDNPGPPLRAAVAAVLARYPPAVASPLR